MTPRTVEQLVKRHDELTAIIDSKRADSKLVASAFDERRRVRTSLIRRGVPADVVFDRPQDLPRT